VSRVVVMTELRVLHPTERWPRLVASLAEKLESSGLGRILDLDTIRSQAVDSSHVAATVAEVVDGWCAGQLCV
jgi:hypothetical protein